MRIFLASTVLLTVALPTTVVAQVLAPPAGAATLFAGAMPVDNDSLGKVTGEADLAQVVQAENTSTVSGNSVTGNSQTGTINFDSSSFQNLNGVSLLSANTGNNVSINSSLNVNVAINQ